jgi:membrane-bound metal-dependent hydrolase YbcI (DUF457 family)
VEAVSLPSPVGHVLAALAVHTLSAAPDEIALRRRSVIVVAAALAPDLDFAWRLLDGRNHHQAETHSVGAALIAGVLVALLASVRHWPRPAGLGLAATMGWMSHVLLDYLGRDTHPPIGLLALWPFQDGYHKFPVPLFLDIGRTLDLKTLGHNGLALAWEAFVLCPILVAAWRLRNARGGA